MSVLRRQQLSKRDDDYNNDWPDRNWYWSDEARTVKYGVLFGVLLLSFGVIMGMWIHADRRMKSGLPPLRYHRWLVSRHRRAQWEPQLQQQPEQQFSFYQHQHPNQETDYSMHAVPPPAYNPNYAQPPVYTGGPPVGASKVDPSQHPANQNAHGEGSSSNAPAYPPPSVGAPAYS